MKLVLGAAVVADAGGVQCGGISARDEDHRHGFEKVVAEVERIDECRAVEPCEAESGVEVAGGVVVGVGDEGDEVATGAECGRGWRGG